MTRHSLHVAPGRDDPRRDYDTRTGRPLVEGRDAPGALSDEELEAEVTIAAARPTRRAERLDALLLELTRRGRGRGRHMTGRPPLSPSTRP